MRRNFLLNVLLRDRIHRFIYMSKCCSNISLVLLTGAPLSLSTTVHLTSNVATGTPYAGAGRKSLSPLHLLDDVSYILPDEWDYSVFDLFHVFLIAWKFCGEEFLFVVHALLDQWEVNQRDDEGWD